MLIYHRTIQRTLKRSLNTRKRRELRLRTIERRDCLSSERPAAILRRRAKQCQQNTVRGGPMCMNVIELYFFGHESRRMLGPRRPQRSFDYDRTHRQQPPRFRFDNESLEFGSGRFSRVTKCITVVFPCGRFNALSVTEPCRKRP